MAAKSYGMMKGETARPGAPSQATKIVGNLLGSGSPNRATAAQKASITGRPVKKLTAGSAAGAAKYVMNAMAPKQPPIQKMTVPLKGATAPKAAKLVGAVLGSGGGAKQPKLSPSVGKKMAGAMTGMIGGKQKAPPVPPTRRSMSRRKAL